MRLKKMCVHSVIEIILYFFPHILKEYAETHPDKALTTKLVMSQLYLSQGHVYEACDLLKSLGDLRYKPGVVCLILPCARDFMNVKIDQKISKVALCFCSMM